MVRLQSRIRSEFRVIIRLVELLGANTLSKMAQKIDENSPAVVIDWEAETALPDHLPIPGPNIMVPANAAHTSEKETVLLTGATGFLGQHVLKQLVAYPEVDRIYCVAVRDAATRDVTKLDPAVRSEKVVFTEGDLALPRLGLSAAETHQGHGLSLPLRVAARQCWRR